MLRFFYTRFFDKVTSHVLRMHLYKSFPIFIFAQQYYKMWYLFLFLLSVVSGEQFVKDEIKVIFGSKNCIEGSISNLNLADVSILKVKDAKNQNQQLRSNATISEVKKVKEKSILSKLNEFSQFIDLDYYFKLEKEEGEAHDRTFTVSLSIGEEKYVAKGKSIKKAQQNAAELLFKETNYVPVPSENKLANEDDSLTPTVLLNNVCSKFGLKAEYTLVNEENILQSNIIISENSKKSYIQKLNDSLYANKSFHVKKDISNTKGPFTIKLYVDEHVFYGSAQSIQVAKHDAASKAIDFLLENRDILNGACSKEDSKTCKKKKELLKSSISLAHEAAQYRNMHLECEVINESGPDHRKTFVTQCKIGELVTIGEGHSKKESKKIAAKNILERIHELSPISKEMQINMLNKKKTKKNKKKKVIKTSLEEFSLLAQQALQSTFGFKNNEKRKEGSDVDNLGKSKSHKKKNKITYQNQSFQDEVLKLSRLLNFNVDYSDFGEDNKHFSFLSLHFTPDYLCYGEGLTEFEARNKAAGGALNLLYQLEFKNHFTTDYLPLESDIKASLQNMIHLDVKKESD